MELPDPFSFPSGHATAALAVAAALSLAYPVLTPGLALLAAAVAASRVVLGVHHVSDVLAGASLGLAAALACFPLIL